MTNPLYDSLFGIHANSQTPFLILPSEAGWANLPPVITHAEFLHQSARFAHALTHIGMHPGDRLAAQIHKSPTALALYAACVQSGIVLLPLNTAYTADEMNHFLTDSAAATLVCDAAFAPALTPTAARFNTRLHTLNVDATGTFADIARTKPATFPTTPRTPDDLAALLYTSGTTGRPKGAMLSQNNLLSNAQTLAAYWRFTADDVLLHALPIFHTHGLFVATNVALISGASILLLPRFDLDAIFATLPQTTTLMGVPTFYTRLLADPRLTRASVSHMRLFISGSAPLSAATHADFTQRTGHHILERYGMTETNMNTSNPYDGERRPGSVGFPLPGVELRITDPTTATPLPQGKTGQIEIRGPNVFQGYWQAPQKTTADFRPDGFFITGDLGRIDAEGYLHIVGRNKDLIISGGYNIYPREIEMLLDSQPGVQESAVIGVPHPDLGEAAIALIVPADPTSPPHLETIAKTTAASLARFKQPRKLILTPELPRNTMGKILKNQLRQTFTHTFTPPP